MKKYEKVGDKTENRFLVGALFALLALCFIMLLAMLAANSLLKPAKSTDYNYSKLASSTPDAESISSTTSNSESSTHENQKPINLNKATKEELMTLDGIGEKRAMDIIEYREKIGGFKSTLQIMEVNGIGEKMYDKIKDRLTV